MKNTLILTKNASKNQKMLIMMHYATKMVPKIPVTRITRSFEPDIM